ncbi:hypothetical protein PRZ48_008436 [Zasmidium cellare]|uniref:ABC transporter n=1 Tax=Zasmidium cellare TaxID=395010 RepID=A0ABR0EFI1_ZASCE|nr:hypothetical protein PRZ48_008436 [Zasmidium cellare]
MRQEAGVGYIINVYVFFSLLFDIPQTRTLWLRPGPRALPALFTAGVVSKAVVLCLEAKSKRKSLFPPYRVYAPEALVSLYDRTALWWLNPLFWTGYNGYLSIEKLYAVDADLSSENVETVFQRAWPNLRAEQEHGKWALFWAVFHTVKTTFLAMVFPRFCLSALKLCQPLLISRVTSLLSDGISGENANYGRGLIGATALVYTGITITTALYQRAMHRMVTKIRGIIITAVHSKALTLDSSKLGDNTALTLISADVNRICSSLQDIDQIFAAPVEVGVAMYLLQRQIGVSCVAPIAVTLAVATANFFNVNTAIPMQKAWLNAVSERVAFTSSVLGFPKGFKMLGLTTYFTDRIQGMRVAELAKYAAYRKYVTWRNVYGHIPQAFAPPFTLMMFSVINGQRSLDPTTAFTALALVALLSSPISEMLHTVPQLFTALASLERVQNFLLIEGVDHFTTCGSRDQHAATPSNAERGDGAIELSVMAPSKADHSQNLLRIEQGTVELGSDNKKVLTDVDIRLTKDDIHLLVGPVGSGKSTLLRTIIGDLPLATGQRIIAPKMNSFAFCSQDPWLPNDTVQNLVLGQSDFDPEWYTTVTSACALRRDIANFPDGDATLVGTKGVSLSGGQRQRIALARAIYARKQMIVADDVLSGLDAGTSRHVFTQLLGPHGLCRQHGMTVILATHSVQYLPVADLIIALGKDGAIVEQGTFKTLNVPGGYVHELGVKGTRDDDPVDIEEATPDAVIRSSAPDKVEVAQQDLARKTGDTSVYRYYFKSIGTRLNVILAISTVTFIFGNKFPEIWVKFWSEAETSNDPRPLGMWIGVSFLLACIACIGCGAQIWTMLVHAVPKSSARLHEQLLNTVMHATYSFFVNTDSGITLNRFSNDMSLIELDLAGAFMQFTAAVGMLIASGAIIVSGATYAAATMPLILLVLYGIQKFYLRTSRQLRFLDLEAQAPLLTHCSETLAGVTTIRAFGWQYQSHQKCVTLLDKSQRAYYLMLCIQRWLGLVLGLVTAAVAVVVVSMAMTIPQSSSAGSIGVSLLSVLSFSFYMTFTINAWTALETSLGAVARCKNFEASTKSEDRPEDCQVPEPSWPATGEVLITNLRASYTDGGAEVLKDISVSIKAGEKVGICGRSGSGKSSLLLALFRLLDSSSGSIQVDSIDLATVPRQEIRARLAALPQESLIFPGTVLSNLSPVHGDSEGKVETVLKKVGLFDVVTSRGGLHTDITSLGLSQGQIQLFAVARALLRKSKFLILDEMSSSVDAVTEENMTRLIREEFQESTVIAVAHRLRTIMEFDRVVVMDNGRVLESGAPEELLGRGDSAFRGLWENSRR